MITQAVVGVLQFHSEHENVFLTALYYPTYWAIYHIVWGPDSALLKLQNQISLYSHIPTSLQVLFWRELLRMNVDKLRSLPAPFLWAQCEFHWKYIHPIKGTPERKDGNALLQKLALDAEQWIPIMGAGTGGCHTWVQIPPPPLSYPVTLASFLKTAWSSVSTFVI